MNNRELYGDPRKEQEKEARTPRRPLLRRIAWGWLLRLVLLIVAVGVVIYVYGGDVYLALVIAGCALGIFVRQMIPDHVPEIIWWALLAPFVLGVLIPLWRVIETVFNGNLVLTWDGIIGPVVILVAYVVAALVVVFLPRGMRGPFTRFLPGQPRTSRTAPYRWTGADVGSASKTRRSR